MAYNNITTMNPTSTLWVQAGAASGGNGSSDKPFASVQEAVSKALPGTAVMVREGTYVENVKIPTKGGGTDGAPIWILSADGQGAAHIIAKSNSAPVIQGLGTDNIMVDGFKIEGGSNGIQFSQSGNSFSNIVSNIVVSNNTILSAREDGIKISQADNVQILNNTIIGTGDQAIDFVAVNDSRIAGNDVSQITGASAIFAKGGSTNVVISDNYVHNVAVDGIILGGWTSETVFRPDFKSYEAKNITVTDNYIEGVGKRPINILGAIESLVSENILKSNPSYGTVISVESGSPNWTTDFVCRNVTITDNVFDRAKQLITINKGNGEGIVFADNRTDGLGNFDFSDVGVGNSWQPKLAHGSWGPGGPVKVSYNWELNATEFIATGKWNSVKTIVVESETAANVSLKNFVQVDAEIGGSGHSTASISDAKRGTISTGSGNDHVVVSVLTNEGKGDNSFTIATGSGNDTIVFEAGVANSIAKINDGRHSTAIIDAGDGSDTIDLSGLKFKLAMINGGAGNDTMTGSSGKDAYVYDSIAGGSNGHDLITNFQVGIDSLQLNDGLSVALSASDVEGNLQVKLTDNTVITFIGVGIDQAGLLIA